MSNQILSQNNQILNSNTISNNNNNVLANSSITGIPLSNNTTIMMMNTTPMSFPSNTKINQIVSMTPSSSQISNTVTAAVYSIASPTASSTSTIQPLPTSSVSNISTVAYTASSSTAPPATTSIAPTVSSNQSPSVASNTSGFANCSHCGSNGVKAAFYGKSKLYCSVACQNGKRNPQQQQQSHGVKRTIDALNYSINSGQAQTISLINQPAAANNTISITSSPNLSSNTTIPTLITTNSFYTISTDSNSIQNNIFPTLLPASQQTVFNTIQTQPASVVYNTTNGNTATLISDSNGKPATIKAILPQISALTDNLVKLPDFETKHSESSDNNSQSDHSNGNAAKKPRKSVTASSGSVSALYSKMSSVSTITSTIDEVLKKNLIETTNTKTNDSNLTKPVNKIKHSSAQNEDFSENIFQVPSTIVPKNFDWISYLKKSSSDAAPVFFFKNAPLCSFWKKIPNIVVEIPNKYEDIEETYYWFGLIVKCSGYYVKIRYIGFEENETSDDFWMHMCDKNIQHVGYSKTVGINLVPPQKISDRFTNWKSFLCEKLPRYVTIPRNFHSTVTSALKTKFEKNMLLELVDKNELSKMRVAKILENIGGRLRLKYENLNDPNDFWCHENSPLIHPIGWSVAVGHDITNVSEEYKRNSHFKYSQNNYEKNECSKDMFICPYKIELPRFKPKMKLEVIDPLNPSKIRVATVTKLLADNYVMLKLDKMKETNDKSLEFCYHRTSSSLFNAGFCKANSLELEKPFDYSKKFSWEKYLEETNSEFAPEELFFKGVKGFMNPFKVGMKLESVELVRPFLICPATVVSVTGRLIRINFDGWTSDFDQYIDCESCDIFPIGWCELVGYQLEMPVGDKTDIEQQKNSTKKTTKNKEKK